MLLVGSYIAYLAITIAVTVYVARTLFENGRAFLVEAFAGNAEMADSVNKLLVVGFYLINLGYVALVLRFGAKPIDLAGSFEFVSTKIGIVLLILGAMHFMNLYVFSYIRRHGFFQSATE